MKLTIEHLSPYLPYGLRLYKNYEGHELKKEMTPGNILSLFEDYAYKPILRPLSDLTKEISHNGERFVPINRIAKLIFNIEPCEKFGFVRITKFADDESFSFHTRPHHPMSHISCNPQNMPYKMVQKLFEWHFDVFNLIENKLAININTLAVK